MKKYLQWNDKTDGILMIPYMIFIDAGGIDPGGLQRQGRILRRGRQAHSRRTGQDDEGRGQAACQEEVTQSPAFTQASSKRTCLMALPSGVK